LARALATDPLVLIADEPTASLDLLSRLEALRLLRSLQTDSDLAALFISHDIGAVSLVSDHVAVMYLGKIIERGPVRAVLERPQHPYTAALLAAVPGMHWRERRDSGFSSIPGEVPSIRAIPSGCAFHPRCAYAIEQCARQAPPDESLGDPAHVVACWRAKEIAVELQAGARMRALADAPLEDTMRS